MHFAKLFAHLLSQNEVGSTADLISFLCLSSFFRKFNKLLKFWKFHIWVKQSTLFCNSRQRKMKMFKATYRYVLVNCTRYLVCMNGILFSSFWRKTWKNQLVQVHSQTLIFNWMMGKWRLIEQCWSPDVIWCGPCFVTIFAKHTHIRYVHAGKDFEDLLSNEIDRNAVADYISGRYKVFVS